MPIEGFVEKKQAEIIAEQEHTNYSKTAKTLCRHIFSKVDAENKEGEPINAKTEVCETELGVCASLRQIPHEDRSGVKEYNLYFEVEGILCLYASIGSFGITYGEDAKPLISSRKEAHLEVIGVLNDIAEAVNTQNIN